jgi:hypothetical protein
MKAWVRSWRHGSEVDWHHVGYLLERGPTGLDDRFEPRSTLGWGERYATLLKKVKQGFETIRKRRLIINLREVVSFRARMRLVVSTRLQVWHSSLLLQPRVIRHPFRWMLHMGLFTYSEKEMRFPSCNFCLKKRLANWHNSRQGCNLDELNN